MAKPISQEQHTSESRSREEEDDKLKSNEWERENATNEEEKKNRKKAKFLRNVACTSSKNKTFEQTQNVMKEQRKKKSWLKKKSFY